MAIRTPEFLQTKSYTALRDRLMFAHGGDIIDGVWDTGDFAVTQRGAGANMSVDVAAGYCLVPANHPSNAGYYHVQNDAVANATITSAHATLPRIDQICVQVTDTTDGGGASDAGNIVVLAGTPTSGATLTNRSGAASLPNGTLRLADVLVGAAVTSITTSNIQDRRQYARPDRWVATSDNTAATVGVQVPAVINSGALALRVEVPSGAKFLAVMVHFEVDAVTTNYNHRAALVRNGTKVAEIVADGSVGQPIPGMIWDPGADTQFYGEWLVNGSSNGNVAGTYAVLGGAIVNKSQGQGMNPLGLVPLYLAAPTAGSHVLDLYHGGTGGNTTVRNRRLWCAVVM